MSCRALAGVLLLSLLYAVPSRVYAFCSNEGPYNIRQCSTPTGTPAWFAPPPAGSGTLSAAWWQIGMGNRAVVDPTQGASSNPIDGDGFIDTPNPGRFIGNDSGALTIGMADGTQSGGMDLISATDVGGPPGSLCFSVSASWALFLDGCADQNRTYSSTGNTVDISDYYLNPYFSAATGGRGIYSDYALVDSAMGVLLTESTSRHFALAFFSSTTRAHNENDIFDRGFDMGALINGDPNPIDARNNIVPWQDVPFPFVQIVSGPSPNLDLRLTWPSIRIVHDGSSRPNTAATIDPISGRHVLGLDPNGLPLTGVGVLQEPVLARYQVEYRAFDSGTTCDPNAAWTNVGPPLFQAPQINQVLESLVTVPEDVCVRLRTTFGRVPTATFRTTPATATTRNQNRFDAQAGRLGDLGYEVVGPGIPVLPCSAPPGAAEVCNGLDDNCNGSVDENIAAVTCGIGACTRTVPGCVSGEPPACVPGSPSTDICDSIDNDCNGLVDDRDFDLDTYPVCVDCNDVNPNVSPGTEEICNGIDDDCDALTDEDAQGVDSDGDGLRNVCDNCRFHINPGQADSDSDGIGDPCDNCLFGMNPSQEDTDADLHGNVCDNCPEASNPFQEDEDTDGFGDACDNCVSMQNASQTDIDLDLEGDVCDLNDNMIYTLLPNDSTVRYQLESGFGAFNLYRGNLAVLKTHGIYTQSLLDSPDAAQFCGLSSGNMNDDSEPGPGEIIHFLVTGVSGVEGSLGTDSAGQERPNDNPCP